MRTGYLWGRLACLCRAAWCLACADGTASGHTLESSRSTQNPLAASVYQTSRRCGSNAGFDIAVSLALLPFT
jgi:hypothetical protein